MNYKLDYSYELFTPFSYFINAPQTQRSFFAIISAICTASGVLIRSPEMSGKTHIVQSLANLLGKPFYSYNFMMPPAAASPSQFASTSRLFNNAGISMMQGEDYFEEPGFFSSDFLFKGE
jgi:hypothetical protein